MVLSTSAHILRRQILASSRRRFVPESILHRTRFLHATSGGQSPRKRNFFSSNANLKLEESSTKSEIAEAASQAQKRKAIRSPPGKRSLRRVAAEAQRSQENHAYRKDTAVIGGAHPGRFMTAICAAEEYDMRAVVRILRSHGLPIDPDGTGFLEEMVVHTRGVNDSDIFIFPSGTMVSWSLPEDVAKNIATSMLKPAAVKPYDPNHLEMEDLEYKEDASRENSSIRGDVITLGTKAKLDPQAASPATSAGSEAQHPPARLPTTLAKIAFSSGLARSTKLAVLETMLSTYITSTRSIPLHFTQSSLTGLPFSRAYMRSKTGELLEIRAQLNHYSELTDSLPDLFWDANHDLGLEGYYDQVGKALDVGIRIRTLNEKMDYAQEIASILRETLSHSHTSKLEWIIIVLIAVEIVMGVLREWRERKREEAVVAAEGKGK